MIYLSRPVSLLGGSQVRDGTHSDTTVETPHLAFHANRSTAADSSCPGVIQKPASYQV